LYDNYVDWCKNSEAVPYKKNGLGRALRKHFPWAKPGVDARGYRVYRGVALRSN
jgi:hypothetical protein